MITIVGSGLTIADIGAVAQGAAVAIPSDAQILDRVHRSRRVIDDGVSRGQRLAHRAAAVAPLRKVLREHAG